MSPIISQILATSSEVRLDRKVETNDPLSHLRKGQIVEARVERTFSTRQARLTILGKSVSAQTHLPLQKGQKMVLRVTQAGAHPRFQMVETRGGDGLQVPSDTLQILGRSGPYAMLSRLFKTLAGSDTASGGPFGTAAVKRMARLWAAMAESADQPDRQAVQSFLTRGGMTWENKLVSILNAQKTLPPALVQRLIQGDLKALALLATQGAAEDNTPWMEDMRAFLDGLERLQLLNHQISKESGRYVVPLPFLLDEQLQFGQMLIDLGKEPLTAMEKKDRVVRVSLLLEMSNLGHLEAEINMLKNAMTLIFRVEDDAARTLIDSHLPQLAEKLTSTGFHVHEMRCCTVPPQILQTASLADRLIDDREGVLSIVI